MKIYKGTVKSKREMSKDLFLTVELDGASYDVLPFSTDQTGCVDVEYVSPYGGNRYAGMVLLPEAGQSVLVCTVDNDLENKFYYLGSIIKPKFDIVQRFSPTKVGEPDPDAPHDPEDHQYNNQSMSYGFKSPLQNQIIIQEGRDAESDSKRIKLFTSRGHGLFMDDSSETNKINLRSAWQGAGLELRDEKADKDKSKSPNSVNLYGKGNVIVRSWEGEMTLGVRDGRNIKILNNSTGGNATSGGPEAKSKSFGNVMVHTDRGDIRISSGGNGVFIDCFGGDPDQNIPYASFQVRSQNKIHLYASNGIDLKAGGDINIMSENGKVNIQGSEVQLNPTYAVSDKMGVRKCNDEIYHEFNEGVPQPFFIEDTSFEENYTEGRNNDPRLF